MDNSLNLQLLYNFKHANINGIRNDIKNGSNIHFNNNLILKYLSQKNNVNLLKLLFSLSNLFSDDDYAHSLVISIVRHATKNIFYLLQKIPNLHDKDDFYLKHSINNGLFDVVEYLLDNTEYNNIQLNEAIHNAITSNHIEVIKLIIEKYPDIEIENNKLYISISFKTFEISEYLIDYGLKIENIIDELVNPSEIKKYNELIIFLRKNKLKNIYEKLE